MTGADPIHRVDRSAAAAGAVVLVGRLGDGGTAADQLAGCRRV